MNSRRILMVAGAFIGLGLLVVAVGGIRDAWMVSKVVSRNVEAHGGADAIEAIDSLRITGQMDLGHGLRVPYVMEHKEPGRFCLEYTFDGAQVVQCTNGTTGFKIVPFEGSDEPIALDDAELREIVDAAVPMGLLVDRWDRGISVDPPERIQDHDRVADRVVIEMPSGAERTLYLDPATGLEYRSEGTRDIEGRTMVFATTYHDWRQSEGVFFARRQVTRTQGVDETYEVTIENIQVNPPIDDQRFEMPGSAAASNQ